MNKRASLTRAEPAINGFKTRGGAMAWRPLSVLVSCTLAMCIFIGCSAIQTRDQNTVSSPTPTPVIPFDPSAGDIVPLKEARRDGIIELSIAHPGPIQNKFFDLNFEIDFTSPRGIRRRVAGFYHSGNVWQARFRPDESGRWTYSYAITAPTGTPTTGQGSFAWTSSEIQGVVKQNPNNPFRWILSNGQPYFPIGIQDCIGLQDGNLADLAIDGEMRNTAQARTVSLDDYFSIYAQAGFNLFRFSQQNCSYSLLEDLDHYRLNEMSATDELLALAHRHGFRIMFGIFGFYDHANTSNPDLLQKQKRFIRYAVARWGAYVDFWELLNESQASDQWVTEMADSIRSIDPFRMPISISDPKPGLAAIDITSPHWYESEGELQSDRRVQELAVEWKRAGKPVIVGEQGNSGMNWDPRSALRMRVRAWTALFQEISFIFWNTSWAKNGMFEGVYTPGGAANIYLGPEEREYVRVLQNFASRLDAQVQSIPVQVSAPEQVRAYGLASSNVTAVYLHHFENHTSSVNQLRVTLDLAGNSKAGVNPMGQWIDPSSGKVLEQLPLRTGVQTLHTPSFQVDLALLIY